MSEPMARRAKPTKGERSRRVWAVCRAFLRVGDGSAPRPMPAGTKSEPRELPRDRKVALPAAI